MKNGRSRYYGHRSPAEIISHAVWVYHRFCLSFRDVEDLLAERGIIVSYETIRHWCQKFGPGYARRLKRRQGSSRRYLAFGRTLRENQRRAALPLASSRSRRGRDRPPTSIAP